jgi:hypothetical protein
VKLADATVVLMVDSSVERLVDQMDNVMAAQLVAQ